MANTKNLFSPVYAVGLALLCSGCSNIQMEAATNQAITQERLANARTIERNFGIWQLENCRLSAQRADIRIFTDGRMTANSLFFRMHSHTPLGSAPSLTLWGVGGFDLDMDGRDSTWSFKFPFGPAEVAKMIEDNVFIVVGYTPTQTNRKLNAVFSASELPQALEFLSQNCLDHSDK